MHGREEGKDLDLCDVCYWRKRAEYDPALQPKDADEEMNDVEFRRLLEIFAAGCFAGTVADWPQLKPVLAWAEARIRKLEAFCLGLSATPDAVIQVMEKEDLKFEDLNDPMQKLAFSLYTEIVITGDKADFLLGRKDGGGVSLPDKAHGLDHPRPGTTAPK